jgi:hypothetical protein
VPLASKGAIVGFGHCSIQLACFIIPDKALQYPDICQGYDVGCRKSYTKQRLREPGSRPRHCHPLPNGSSKIQKEKG